MIFKRPVAPLTARSIQSPPEKWKCGFCINIGKAEAIAAGRTFSQNQAAEFSFRSKERLAQHQRIGVLHQGTK